MAARHRLTVNKQSLHVEARRRAAVDKRRHQEPIDGGCRSSNSVYVRRMTITIWDDATIWDDSDCGQARSWQLSVFALVGATEVGDSVVG
jgi:hypothetical protein